MKALFSLDAALLLAVGADVPGAVFEAMSMEAGTEVYGNAFIDAFCQGDMQSYISGRACGISWRTIAPRGDECENLLAIFTQQWN